MGRRKINASQPLKTKKTIAKVFKQRKDGIIKKAFELSTLCEVEVGVIIYGPEGDSPLVWPKEPETLNKILKKYQVKKSTDEHRKRAKDVSFFDGKSNEINLENSMWDEINIDGFSVEQLLELACSLDSKIDAVKAKIDVMRSNQVIIPGRNFKGVQSYDGQFRVTNDHYAQFLELLRCEQDVVMDMKYGEGCCDLSNTSTLLDSRGPTCLSYPSVGTARDVMGFGPSDFLNMDTSVGNCWSCLRCPSVGTAGEETRSGDSYLLNTDASVDNGWSCLGDDMGYGASYPLQSDTSLEFGPLYPRLDSVPDPFFGNFQNRHSSGNLGFMQGNFNGAILDQMQLMYT